MTCVRLAQRERGRSAWTVIHGDPTDAELASAGYELGSPTIILDSLEPAERVELVKLLGKSSCAQSEAEDQREEELLARCKRRRPPPIDLDPHFPDEASDEERRDAKQRAIELAESLLPHLRAVGLGIPPILTTGGKGVHLDLSDLVIAEHVELLRGVGELVREAARRSGIPLLSEARSKDARARGAIYLDDTIFNHRPAGRQRMWQLEGSRRGKKRIDTNTLHLASTDTIRAACDRAAAREEQKRARAPRTRREPIQVVVPRAAWGPALAAAAQCDPGAAFHEARMALAGMCAVRGLPQGLALALCQRIARSAYGQRDAEQVVSSSYQRVKHDQGVKGERRFVELMGPRGAHLAEILAELAHEHPASNGRIPRTIRRGRRLRGGMTTDQTSDTADTFVSDDLMLMAGARTAAKLVRDLGNCCRFGLLQAAITIDGRGKGAHLRCGRRGCTLCGFRGDWWRLWRENRSIRLKPNEDVVAVTIFADTHDQFLEQADRVAHIVRSCQHAEKDDLDSAPFANTYWRVAPVCTYDANNRPVGTRAKGLVLARRFKCFEGRDPSLARVKAALSEFTDDKTITDVRFANADQLAPMLAELDDNWIKTTNELVHEASFGGVHMLPLIQFCSPGTGGWHFTRRCAFTGPEDERDWIAPESELAFGEKDENDKTIIAWALIYNDVEIARQQFPWSCSDANHALDQHLKRTQTPELRRTG